MSTLQRFQRRKAVCGGFSSKFSAYDDFMDVATGDGEVFPTTQSHVADVRFPLLGGIKKVGEQAVTELSKLYALRVKYEQRT